MSEYVFDNKEAETEQRFGALETLFDPVSKRYLEPYVVAGAHCLEVGGGSGSIARWMSERAGDRGRVVVTDINTRFLDGIVGPNIEVRQHDIVSDSLEEAAFDVAHTRLVLLHIPERKRAVERMIAALKPGGWLVLQEFDSLSMQADTTTGGAEHLLKTLTVLWELMMARGANLRFGREVYPLLKSFGLSDVAAEGHVSVWRGGSGVALLCLSNFDQMHDALISSGRLTEQEFADDIARLDDPNVIWPSSVLWTTCGRKP
jgi:SAM-dependent methyltransferase